MGALDPRNARATARPVTTFLGIDEDGQEHEYPVLGPQFWPPQAFELVDSMDSVGVTSGVGLIVGETELADHIRLGGTPMLLLMHIKDHLADAGGEVSLGESDGSATSSEATGPDTSTPRSDAPTASTYGPTLAPVA